MRRRVASVLLASCVLSITVAAGAANTSTWCAGGADTLWTNGLNWSGSTWASGNNAIFATSGTLATSGTVTVGNITFNSPSDFLITGGMTTSGTGVSYPSWTMTVSGTNMTVATPGNYTISALVALPTGSTMLNVSVTTGGTLKFQNFAGATYGGFTKSGSGTFDIAISPNSWDNTTHLNTVDVLAGTVNLRPNGIGTVNGNGNNALGISLLKLASGATITTPSQANLQLNGSGTNGDIQGTIQGQINLMVNTGTCFFRGDGKTLNTADNGFQIGTWGTIVLDNAATNVLNRVPDTTPIRVSDRATLRLIGNDTQQSSETFGPFYGGGANGLLRIEVFHGSGTSASLTAGSMTQGNGMVLFSGSDLGLSDTSAVASRIFTSAPLVGGIIPSGRVGAEFAGYDSTRGVFAYDLARANTLDAAAVGQHVLINSAAQALPGTFNINSLKIDGAYGIQVGPETLSIGNNTAGAGIIQTGAANPLGLWGGTIQAGTGTGCLYVTADTDLRIGSAIQATKIFKNGNGKLTLGGALTGGCATNVYLYEGGLEVDGPTVTLPGGILTGSGSLTVTSGQLSINGVNNQTTGGLFVTSGTLSTDAELSIGAENITVNGGAYVHNQGYLKRIVLNGGKMVFNSLSWQAWYGTGTIMEVPAGNTGTLQTNVNYGASLVGTGTIVKTGTGLWTVQNNTLNPAGQAANLQWSAGGIQLDNNSDVRLVGPIAGTGTLKKTAGSTLYITGSPSTVTSYASTIWLSGAGILDYSWDGVSNGIGTGNIKLDSTATFRLTPAAPAIFPNVLDTSVATGAKIILAGTSITLSGTLLNKDTTYQCDVDTTLTGSFTSTGNFIKTGLGKLTFSGPLMGSATLANFKLFQGSLAINNDMNLSLSNTGGSSIWKNGAGLLTITAAAPSPAFNVYWGNGAMDVQTIAAVTIVGPTAGNGLFSHSGTGSAIFTGNPASNTARSGNFLFTSGTLDYTCTDGVSNGLGTGVITGNSTSIIKLTYGAPGVFSNNLALDATGATAKIITGGSPMTLAGSIGARSTTLQTDVDTLLSGTLCNIGNLSKTGLGTLTISGPVFTTGTSNLGLQLVQGNITVSSICNVDLSSSGTVTGQVIWNSTGTCNLTSFTSATTLDTIVNAGTLVDTGYYCRSSAFGTGKVIVNNGATFKHNVAGAGDTLHNIVQLNGGSTMVTDNIAWGNFFGADSGIEVPSGQTGTLYITGPDNRIDQATVLNLRGDGILTKSGTGRLVLTGTNANPTGNPFQLNWTDGVLYIGSNASYWDPPTAGNDYTLAGLPTVTGTLYKWAMGNLNVTAGPTNNTSASVALLVHQGTVVYRGGDGTYNALGTGQLTMDRFGCLDLQGTLSTPVSFGQQYGLNYFGTGSLADSTKILVSAPATLAGPVSILTKGVIDAQADLLMSSTVSGGGLYKYGPARLTLAGTVTSTVYFQEGTLTVSSPGNVQVSSSGTVGGQLTVAGPGTTTLYSYNGSNSTADTLVTGGRLVMGGYTTAAFGTGNVIVTNAILQQTSQAGALANKVQLNDGTFRTFSDWGYWSTPNASVEIPAGRTGTVEVGCAAPQHDDGVTSIYVEDMRLLTGSGTFRKAGTGYTFFSQGGPFTGNIQIDEGELLVDADSWMPAGVPKVVLNANGRLWNSTNNAIVGHTYEGTGAFVASSWSDAHTANNNVFTLTNATVKPGFGTAPGTLHVWGDLAFGATNGSFSSLVINVTDLNNYGSLAATDPANGTRGRISGLNNADLTVNIPNGLDLSSGILTIITTARDLTGSAAFHQVNWGSNITPGTVSYLGVTNASTTPGANWGAVVLSNLSYAPGLLSGVAFSDTNHNGIKDAGEALQAGWTLTLTTSSTTLTAVTDTNGAYAFALAGINDLTSYTLTESSSTGWTHTLPASGFYTGLVGPGQSVPDLDFGNYLPAAEDIPGDINRDKIVDQADYTVWYNHYGQTPATWADGDVTGDNIVDQADYTVWYNHYGQTGSNVPEPMTLATLAIGGLAMLRRRK